VYRILIGGGSMKIFHLSPDLYIVHIVFPKEGEKRNDWHYEIFFHKNGKIKSFSVRAGGDAQMEHCEMMRINADKIFSVIPKYKRMIQKVEKSFVSPSEVS
jgi:hypothetical protein